MNAVLVPLVARREEPTLEGAAARASGVDVEAPRLDCSADEWHDSERLRERRNQPSWVSGPRANASDAGLCNMARRRLRPTLRARVGRVSRGGQKTPKPPQDPSSVGGVRAAGQLLGYVPLGISISFRILLNYSIALSRSY